MYTRAVLPLLMEARTMSSPAVGPALYVIRAFPAESVGASALLSVAPLALAANPKATSRLTAASPDAFVTVAVRTTVSLGSPHHIAPLSAGAAHEIGRASCRGRV